MATEKFQGVRKFKNIEEFKPMFGLTPTENLITVNDIGKFKRAYYQKTDDPLKIFTKDCYNLTEQGTCSLEKEDQYMFTGSIKVLNEFINNLVEKYKKEGTNIEDSLNDPTQFKLVIGGGRRRTSKKRTTKRHATKRHATKRRTTKKRTTRKRGGKDVKPLRFH
jgi:hypothetical protein